MWPKLIVFDVDGTLAETERLGHRVAFTLAFREAGLPYEWDEALYGELLRVSGGRERIRHFLEVYRPDDRVAAELLADPERIAALHRRKNEIYAEIVKRGELPLRPGVRRLIEEARAVGIRLAVATTTSRENVEALLAHYGLEEAFELLATAQEVPVKKPDPAVYRYVLDALAVAPEDALAVEDSRNGLLAAVGAGIPTLVTPSTYTRGEDFTEAWLVLSDLGEPGAPARDLRTGEEVVVTLPWLESRFSDRRRHF
ncbi:HAD-IA family hydrolase [Brockia lithotrophica]|uniref:HAD superfamily hydrolase (TIGR01509 family) n=1 Tax=Brockia lithotrophica TaxID=933949 RepID=A0A660KUV6_9BACL|nr:HAD-IA family hydrolase [Brockia lithotrophica]RKQ83517.1 HAD superfamily hydrolase (TIGR01509 family) [Brockia lithotrophica]